MNQADNSGHTPLWIASEEGHLEIVKLLIESGGSVNRANSYGNIPLHISSKMSHLQIVKILINIFIIQHFLWLSLLKHSMYQ